jgi:hypothetical protein
LATTVSSCVQPVTPVGAENVRAVLFRLSSITSCWPGAVAGTVTVGLLLLAADTADPRNPTALSTGSTVTVRALVTLSVAYVRGRRLAEPEERLGGPCRQQLPMTVGGKLDCDQIDITCDYFSGQIDYVRFTKAANQGPAAGFASSCASLLCSFDSSAATDPDGSIASYAWTFGDGATSTAANPSHTYAAAWCTTME